MNKTSTDSTLKNAIVFCFFGLSLVFPLGLLMLTVGPSRMLAEKAANENWSHANENIVQKIAIVIFLAAVLLVTIYISRFFYKSQNNTTKRVLLFFSAIALMVSLYIFSFRPELLVNSNTDTTNFNKSENAEFHFGSYPDAEKVKELKSQNYTAIISLLNKMVIPAEPILMEEEVTNTSDVGIKLISIPMLPWIDDSDTSLLKIKNMAHNLKGKYYVHCYLGKDRANVFRNIIANENSKLKIKSELGSNNIDGLKSFERGKIIKLQQHIYFTPYPTDDEFFGFILNGRIKQVVCIMDPKTDGVLIEKEQKIMKQYNQKFLFLPISDTNSDTEIQALIDRILTLKQPILVNSYSTKSIISERFIKIFNATIKNKTIK
jgi:hypothetical protein